MVYLNEISEIDRQISLIRNAGKKAEGSDGFDRT